METMIYESLEWLISRKGHYEMDDNCQELIDVAISTMRKYQTMQADYENRLKADLKAILVELQLEIHELENPYPHDYDNLLPLAQHNAFYDAKSTIEDLVEQKINDLEGEQEPTPQI